MEAGADIEVGGRLETPSITDKGIEIEVSRHCIAMIRLESLWGSVRSLAFLRWTESSVALGVKVLVGF